MVGMKQLMKQVGDKYYYHDDGATCWDKPQPFDSGTPRFK